MPETRRPPIDPETLAAFLEGRLSGEARARVIERLADDEDAYELFLGTAAALDALEAEGGGETGRPGTATPGEAPSATGQDSSSRSSPSAPPDTETESDVESSDDNGDGDHSNGRDGWWLGRVLPFPTGGSTWVPKLAALAATLVAVALLGVWALPRFGPIASSSNQLLAAMSSTTTSPDLVPFAATEAELGVVFRSPGLSPEGLAAIFRLGVRAVDLNVALRAGDRERAGQLARALSDLADGSDLPIAAEVFADLADRLANGSPTPALRKQYSRTEEDYLDVFGDSPEGRLFDFGRWTEAARLAAMAEDSRFFRRRTAAARPLEGFLAAAPSDYVKDRLVSIQLAMLQEPSDFASIAESLKEILKHCGDGRPCLDSQPSTID